MEHGRSSGDPGRVKLATTGRAMQLAELVGSGSSGGRWSWGVAILGVQSSGASERLFDIQEFGIQEFSIWEGFESGIPEATGRSLGCASSFLLAGIWEEDYLCVVELSETVRETRSTVYLISALKFIASCLPFVLHPSTICIEVEHGDRASHLSPLEKESMLISFRIFL
ncbi:hypothetical protein Taro_019561 [Colocasia esculenta]|uniref:Uncharacterized protein n=1 Tax=Colocasia esculenta TaxID=4460 RepID=A0A843ULC7_COLES|nr:hypothetical protein [Colocasia esculenta]